MRQVADLAGDRTASASWRNVAGLDIAGITADSRCVAPGYLFAALPGSRVDGRAFIADAVSRGAVAVLAPEGTVWPPGVPPRPLLEDREPRRRLAQLAAGLAGSQPRVVVAVTGTNGKTSTVEFLRQIWTAGGRKAASLGTLGLIAEGFDPGPGLTTPDPVALAQTLAAARPRRYPARRDGGLVARPRSVPPRRRAAGGRGVHQPDARSPRLPRLGGRATAPPSCGCSPSCCRPVRRWWRAATWMRRRLPRWPVSRRVEGSIFAPSARPDRRSVCWRPNRVPTDSFCASMPEVSGARSCCRCRVGSRPTTP